MKETLYNARKLDETRIKRAFGWIITFRDFPEGSWQTVDGDSMMSQALTYFTKGRAEFYLDGERRGDRVPGILSSEHEEVGRGGTFEIRYVEPTTRLCIPRKSQGLRNKDKLPTVKQIRLEAGQHDLLAGRYLVCLGSVQLPEKTVAEESTFIIPEPMMRQINVASTTLLLQFFD